MATIGQLVDMLRAEARVAAEQPAQGATAERLRELANDTGEMSEEQQEWIAQANEDELRGFVAAMRLLGGGA